MPEIELPYESVNLDEKIIFTISTGLIFLAGQIPIYGLKHNNYLYIQDPFYQFRSIFAMEKGTLLELGLLPVLTSGFLWQLAAGFKLIKVNLGSRYERELFQSGQKVLTLLLSVVLALGLVFTQYYSLAFKNVSIGGEVSLTDILLILAQVLGFNFFVLCFVEIFDKGYGFGSGALCLLTIQCATNLVRELIGFDIYSFVNSNKTEYYGSLANLVLNFSLDFNQVSKNIIHSFSRLALPNLVQFYISIICMLIVIGLSNFRIELPIRSTKMRGMNNIYPIKLLYTGALPLLFALSLLANIQVLGFFISQYFDIPILGSYQLVGTNLTLTNGVLYYLSPPSSPLEVVCTPIRTVVYSSFIVVLSTWFANHWALFSGSAPSDIAKQFKEQGITIGGKRDVSITKELSRIIPVASVSGAFLLSVIGLVGEYFGGYGRGFSAVVGVCSAFGIMEEFVIESQQSGGASQLMSALAGAGLN